MTAPGGAEHTGVSPAQQALMRAQLAATATPRHSDSPQLAAPRSSRTTDRAAHRHSNHRRAVDRGGDARTANNPDERPQAETGLAGTADAAPTLTVIVQPQDFRLPDVLRQIEAGKVVLLMPRDTGRD
jgi:hypothetical protein